MQFVPLQLIYDSRIIEFNSYFLLAVLGNVYIPDIINNFLVEKECVVC